MDIYQSILADHKTQRELSDQLIQTEGDSADRDRLYQALKKELSVHADVEERYFYRPLFKYDEAQDHARHGVAEHHEIDELIKKLDETDYSSPGWLATAKELQHKVHHHLNEEEKDYFPVVKQIFSPERANELGEEYRQMMETNQSS